MRIAISFVAVAITLTAAGYALAQTPDAMPTYLAPERPPEKRLEAPKNAFEVSVGTGYTQGFGNLKSGTGMPSVVTPGAGFDLALGYRINPNWAVLWVGQYSELTAERTNMARSFTTGVAGQYHMKPMDHVDPWLEIGAGYRFLVEDPSTGPNLLTHGLQLARVRAGIDFRAADNVALGPMIGADATLFLFQDLPNLKTNINDPRVSSFVFAGLQGRFDIGQTTKTTGSAVSSASQ